jgi:hypothetical protein
MLRSRLYNIKVTYWSSRVSTVDIEIGHFAVPISHVSSLPNDQNSQLPPQPEWRNQPYHMRRWTIFPKYKRTCHLLPVLASRTTTQLRTQLRVGLLQLFVFRLQIREVLLEIFDLLVLAFSERSL